MRVHGRAQISRSNPRALALCDRCGARVNHDRLDWQFEYAGPKLINLRLLVCQRCNDTPQEQLRTIILPPDPTPIANPRPEFFVNADNPISTIGADPILLLTAPQPIVAGVGSPWSPGWSAGFGPFQNPVPSTSIGNMTMGGGLEAPWSGASPKPGNASALLAPSLLGLNSIGKWFNVLDTGDAYAISQLVMVAPSNMPFLGSGSTTVGLSGSNDGQTLTTLWSGATQGIPGESITQAIASTTAYPYYFIWITGDGVTPAAISYAELWTSGPSTGQTGSEYGA